MYCIPSRRLCSLPVEWTRGYLDQGIELSSFPSSDVYWWDREVLEMFMQYGTKYFRKEAIWDFDWTMAAQRIYGGAAQRISDPRKPFDKLMHRLLRTTQPFARNPLMKILEKLFFLLVRW